MKPLVGVILCSLALPLAADEGMWLYNQFPSDSLKQKYQFQATPEFLENLRLATVRIPGGSGAFVSSSGLLLTNQHLLASGCLAKLSSAEHDYVKDGFYASTQAAELPCAGLDASVLTGSEDVTKQVRGAAKDNAPAAQALQLRNAAIARLEQDCAAKSRNRCSVVKLFAGTRYDLYQYKTYSDVRLVFAPENALAFFGRQRDSLTYLRYGLDIAFLRVYENGKPASTPHFFKWSAEGVKDGDLVLASGSPEPTMRLATSAQLNFYRDTQLPFAAGRLQSLIQKVSAFANQNADNLHAAEPVLTELLARYKTSAGMLIGLRDDRLGTRKTVFESKIRRAVQGSSKLGVEATKVWDEVAMAFRTWSPFEKPYQLLETGAAQGSSLFQTARQVVRISEERGKPNEQRLPEYRNGALEAAEAALDASAPVQDALEQLLLTQYLAEVKNLDEKEVPLKALLGAKSPQDVAAEAVKSTKLRDPAERRRLAASHDAVLKSEDPMIRLAVLLDDPARRVRKKREEVIGSLETSAAEKIEQYRLQLFKDAEYPDATGTPRISFGIVKAYTDRAGVAMPFASTFGGLYYRRNDEGPYQAPQRWVDAKPSINLVAPLDFVSTSDIGGGDPGSPVVNRSGELVGLTFDGNLENLPGIYLYTDEQARAVHVSVEGIVEALRQVYKTQPLLQELGAAAVRPSL